VLSFSYLLSFFIYLRLSHSLDFLSPLYLCPSLSSLSSPFSLHYISGSLSRFFSSPLYCISGSLSRFFSHPLSFSINNVWMQI
jgi:hypothetical protein